MSLRGLLTVALAAFRFLLLLSLRLLPLILGVCVWAVLFNYLDQVAANQHPLFLKLARLIGWVGCAFFWLLFAWLSVFMSYLSCPGKRLNRQLALLYLRSGGSSSHG